jgi:hypothetical protein
MQAYDHLTDDFIIERDSGSIRSELLHHLLQECLEQRQWVLFFNLWFRLAPCSC